MSASQAAALQKTHDPTDGEKRFRQAFNMVLEMAFSGKFHWEMLVKENIDHNCLIFFGYIQLLVKATRLSLSFLRWQKKPYLCRTLEDSLPPKVEESWKWQAYGRLEMITAKFRCNYWQPNSSLYPVLFSLVLFVFLGRNNNIL